MATGDREGRSGKTVRSVYWLKVTLLDSQPPIWRRVEIESDVTLDRLHPMLQVVMGWTNCHMHGFRVPQRAQPGVRQRLLPVESADEKATSLSDLLRRPKDWCIYDYDVGDGWEHKLLLGRSASNDATAARSDAEHQAERTGFAGRSAER